jgi:hypothetical protein
MENVCSWNKSIKLKENIRVIKNRHTYTHTQISGGDG